MGFGHRVYKAYDPRAKIIKKMCDKILKELNISDPLLDLAKELEEVALTDDYFIEKKSLSQRRLFTAVLCCGPWEFPPTCLRSCLLSAGCPDGSRNGKRAWTIPCGSWDGRVRSIQGLLLRIISPCINAESEFFMNVIDTRLRSLLQRLNLSSAVKPANLHEEREAFLHPRLPRRRKSPVFQYENSPFKICRL